ncbi:hypothetical protein [Paenibacillus sp. MMO-58]
MTYVEGRESARSSWNGSPFLLLQGQAFFLCSLSGWEKEASHPQVVH